MHDYNVSQIFHLKLIYLYQTVNKIFFSFKKLTFKKDKKIKKNLFIFRKSLCKI